MGILNVITCEKGVNNKFSIVFFLYFNYLNILNGFLWVYYNATR